jgi:hypothetical protein
LNRFNVFFDQNTPPQLARTLAGFLSAERPVPRVVHIRDVLPITTTDAEWLAWTNAEPGPWIVVSENIRILRNKAELRAFEDSRARMLITPKAYLTQPRHIRSALLLWHWHAVEQTMASLDPPVVLQLPAKRSGRPSIVRR